MSQVFFILLNNNRLTESVPKTAHSAGFLLMTPLVIHKDKILRTSELQLRSRQHFSPLPMHPRNRLRYG